MEAQRDHSYIEYSSIQDNENFQFYKMLRPIFLVEFIFGQNFLSDNYCAKATSKFLFFLMFLLLCGVFYLGVFCRGDTVERWLQLSLYIVPLLAFPCGARIFFSTAYYRLLCRNITDTFMVRFFVTSRNPNTIKETRPPAHNRKWLREIAIKSLIFPLSLELIQWCGFVVFTNVYSNSTTNFIGRLDDEPFHELDYRIWDTCYYVYWIVTVYLVGFVSFQFVFVSRLIVKDTVSFMSLFGNSSMLKFQPVYSRADGNLCFRFLQSVANFFTMDLISSITDQYVYTNCAYVSKDTKNRTKSNSHLKIVPSRVLSSPVGQPYGPPRENTPDSPDIVKSDANGGHISPGDACEVFSSFITEIEDLTSCFTPFTIVVSFFGVANLVTHVSLFVKQDVAHISYWTLFRTILFLLVALRMLLCVQQVSTILGKLPPHVRFVKTSGRLGFENATCPSWVDFIDLLDSFNLGKRSFGFPLTLRQVASIATFLNMTFVIVLSVFKTEKRDDTSGKVA